MSVEVKKILNSANVVYECTYEKVGWLSDLSFHYKTDQN